MLDSKKFIEFQELIGKLKFLPRTGWVVRQVPEPETVAAHSWRMALMALHKEKELKQLGINTDHVVEVCLLHDVGESIVGDIIPEIHQTGKEKISDEKKKQIETSAIQFLTQKYDFPDLEKAFNEYEAQETPAAKVVKNLDKLDMLLQAYEYSVLYPDLPRLDEFMRFNEKDVNLSLFSADLREIKSRQFESKKAPNEFIDAHISAGRLKHHLHNPTKTSLPHYDTTAAHVFRTAVMALYLKDDLKNIGLNTDRMIRSIVSMGKDDDTTESKMISELETLENIWQAYEYTKVHQNATRLCEYVLARQSQIKSPLLRNLLPYPEPGKDLSLNLRKDNSHKR